MLCNEQGIPIGIASTISIILQQQHVSYSQQALFVICSQPYSLKMLWAPIVDAMSQWWFVVMRRYSPRIGRRKTWVVPLQLAIGFMLICFSGTIERTLYSESPNVLFLTVCFLVFYFLAATQDIAVDAWALTLLSDKNKNWQGTANVIGQTLGIHLAWAISSSLTNRNSIFLMLNDPTWTLPWSGKQGPLLTLRQFSLIWGVIFLLFTIYIAVCVKEDGTTQCEKKEAQLKEEKEEEPLLRHRMHKRQEEKEKHGEEEEMETKKDEDLNLYQTYLLYFDILKSPYVIPC